MTAGENLCVYPCGTGDQCVFEMLLMVKKEGSKDSDGKIFRRTGMERGSI